ncbi:hypothetical protein ACHAW5_005787 [Stephanodiscus triporus]|uniref:Uncharacterized protein n=1 Tax=Stephanodiscus triporus TaxID=2934178 RepID=A0ABD3PTQ2_9STRA
MAFPHRRAKARRRISGGGVPTIESREFGGSLAIVNERMRCASSDAGGRVKPWRDDDDDDNDSYGCFDVLFVADPSQSWYQKDSAVVSVDSRSTSPGYVPSRARTPRFARGRQHGTGARHLFSHLATDAVVAFSPRSGPREAASSVN